MRLPPLSGWVIAWVLLVVVNAFNPRTEGLLHIARWFPPAAAVCPVLLLRLRADALEAALPPALRDRRGDRVRQRRRRRVSDGAVTAQLASWGPGLPRADPPHGRWQRARSTSTRRRSAGTSAGARLRRRIQRRRRPHRAADVPRSAGDHAPPQWIAMLLCLGAIIGGDRRPRTLSLIGAGLGVVASSARGALRAIADARLGALLAIRPDRSRSACSWSRRCAPGPSSATKQLNTSLGNDAAQGKRVEQNPEVCSRPRRLGSDSATAGAVGGLGGQRNNLHRRPRPHLRDAVQRPGQGTGRPGLILWPAIFIYVALIVATGSETHHRHRSRDLPGGHARALHPLLIEGSSGFLSGSPADGPYFWFAIGVAAILVRPAPTGVLVVRDTKA